MKKLISLLPSPAIAGVVREIKRARAIAEIKNCAADGADMIDLHLSCLEDDGADGLRAIISSTSLPVLALNYNNDYYWARKGLSEDERVAPLLRAVEAGAAGMDMQGYTFDAKSKDGFFGENKYSFTKGNPKETVTDKTVIYKQCE